MRNCVACLAHIGCIFSAHTSFGQQFLVSINCLTKYFRHFLIIFPPNLTLYCLFKGFNILMRRKPKENNFKAVLETIRELMNTECVVPDWLHDIILGYGDPSAAHYSKMPTQISTMDFNDTFIDMDHLRSCFPSYEIKVKTDDPTKLVRPFK